MRGAGLGMSAQRPDAAVYASEEAARAFRDGVYIPIDETALPVAPSESPFPHAGTGPPFRRLDELPAVPRLRHVVGPSVIALGMGLGAGEFLLWPNLVASGGFSIWWLFWLGVLTQFVVIGEIERWTIATGESILAGMARLDRFGFWPWFFLVATLASFFWPGWAAESAAFVATTLAQLTGQPPLDWQPLALAMLLLIYVALAGSTIVYNALEKFEILLVLLFIPLLIVTLLFAGIGGDDVAGLARGAISIGRVPGEFVTGARFPTLLIAVAYAGSGGTLLLAQSLWIRDKGFGMAAYQGRVAGIRGKNEELCGSGVVFDPHHPVLRERFAAWMRLAHRELFVTFVALIVVSVVITTLVVAATLGTGNAELAGDFQRMVTLQAEALAARAGDWLALAFLLGGALVLFSTQVGIVDTVTRITGDVFYERYGRRTAFWTLKRTFLLFLTIFVAASCTIILLSWRGGATLEGLEPDFLIVIAGPFTMGSMVLSTLVVAFLNCRRLPRALAMPRWKRLSFIWAAALWGWFSAEQLSRLVLVELLGRSGADVDTITLGPVRLVIYGLWLGALAWLVWAVSGSRKG